MIRPQFIVLGIVLLIGLLLAGFNVFSPGVEYVDPTDGRPATGPIELISPSNRVESFSRSIDDQPLLVDRQADKAISITPNSDVAAANTVRLDVADVNVDVAPTEPANHLRGDGRSAIDLSSFSAKDQEILRTLPASCTASIPGFQANVAIPDHSHLEPPPDWSARWTKSSEETAAAESKIESVQPALPQESKPQFSVAANEPFPDAAKIDNAVGNSLLTLASHQIDEPSAPQNSAPAVDPHAELYAETQFPSAVQCAKCHQQIFDEWSLSSHAYASISPMFQRFEETISKLTQGTIGYFCMRCHAPVATTMEHPRDAAIYDGPRVFREGVTCVACHRVKEAYTKSNGERRMEPGDIFQPVYGSSDGSGNATVVHFKDLFKVKTRPDDGAAMQPIHACSIQFEQICQSDFCMSCHQVAVPPGIKLEVVWDQYRASPAYRAGVTCQDCHMGHTPGVNAGYSIGPAAVVSDRVVDANRKHSNHVFYGPGSTIAHPGLFPHDSRADRWTPDQWLEFDWRAGWGQDAFEKPIASGEFLPVFPPTWNNSDDRYDARDLIDSNLKKLQIKNDLRRQVLENGSKIDGPFFRRTPCVNGPLEFEYCVTNLNPGHNMPSGSLGAQPQLWLNVVLIAPDGERIWESGYLDSQGDLADIQSEDVLCNRIPFDRQLFTLQTKFLTTNVKGTDREMYLPINFDIDQLPFIRPAAQPVSVINHPPFIRMEAHSLPPLGSRRATYRVPASVIRGPGTYRLSVRLRSRMEPIYFMKFCGATPEMIRSMNETILDAHPYSVVIQVQ